MELKNSDKRTMRKIRNLTAIILAGGKSSRMGQDKAFLDWHGKLLIQHVIDNLKPVVESVIVVAKEPDDFGFTHIPCFKDLDSSSSPVVGILTGLFYSPTEFNFILGCDTPLVNNAIVKRLYDARGDFDAVVPDSDYGIEPLFGIYRKRCLPVFEECLQRSVLAVRQVLKNLRIKVLLADTWTRKEQMSFLNMNTFAEYESAKQSAQALKENF